MKLSIIIPIFNEQRTVSEIIKKVKSISIYGVSLEIILVNDGSYDSTKKILDSLSLQDNIKIFHHEQNQGKGAAIVTGLKHATGNYILIQDADLEYNPDDIILLYRKIAHPDTVVYGTRLKRLPNLTKEEKSFRFLLHYLGNRWLSLITSLLYGQWITDMETCYKLFPRDVVHQVTFRAKKFDFEPEITAKLLKLGYKIIEVPITTTPRSYKEGKKLHTFRDGSRALWSLIKFRFVD